MAIAELFTAVTAAEAVMEDLRDGDEDFALRMVIRAVNDFRVVLASGDSAAIERFLQPPPSTGDHRWDTLLAAAIGRECHLARLLSPEWTKPSALEARWFVVPSTLLKERDIERTPPELKLVGVILDESAFGLV